MKKILYIFILVVINCKSQKRINNLSDADFINNLIFQFKQNIKQSSNDSIFVIYFQEQPIVNSGNNELIKSYTHSGYIVTIYEFANIRAIDDFIYNFNVFKYNTHFLIFDKSSNPHFLPDLKRNQIIKTEASKNNNYYYEPKSWFLEFDKKGKLERCNPYDCN